MNPVLSIIIPVYNVEDYLSNCLESVIGNDAFDLCEVILVNDGSTDNSLGICQIYAEKHSNIEVVSQPNMGLSEARNTGIKVATGKFLMFLDSDDFLYPGSMNGIIRELLTSSKDIFLGRAYKYYQSEEKYELSQIDYTQLKTSHPVEVFKELDANGSFWFAAWLVIINREILIKNDLFFLKGIYHEDELWVPSVFMTIRSIGFINDGFYCYRLNREGSIVSKPNIKRLFDKITVGEQLGMFASKNAICNSIVQNRRGAIEFGIIMDLLNYRNNEQYMELKQLVKSKTRWLNVGKYKIIWILSRLVGIEMVSRLLAIIK